MRHSKVILSAGALLLSTAAVFAGRASVKSSITTVFVSTSAGGCAQLVTTAPNIFTTGNSVGTKATLRTVGNLHTRKIYGTGTCGSTAGGLTPVPAYFHG